MPVYYSYRRWSTPDQSLGDSDRRQIDAARQRAAELGAVLDDSYCDPGISGFRAKHIKKGALGRFLSAARGEGEGNRRILPGDYLGVEDQDRLGRMEAIDAFMIFGEIINFGIILDIKRQLFNRTILRDQPYLLMGALSEMIRSNAESVRKSKLISDTNISKRARVRAGIGIFGGGRCPVWLKPAGDHYDEVPEKKAIVVRIYMMADSGLGSPTICKTLNDEGVPSFDRRKGDKRPEIPCGWHPAYVNALLRNRQVIGELQFYRMVDGKRVKDGDPIPDHFPKIIDEALFDRVQKAVAERKWQGAGRKGEGWPNLVTGFATCVCGGHLFYDNKHGIAKLRCERHRRGLCPNEKGYPYPIFEEQLLTLTGVGFGKILASLAPQDPRTKVNPIPDMEASLQRKEGRLAALLEKFGDDTNPTIQGAVEAQIVKLGGDIESDKAKLQKARSEWRGEALNDDASFLKRLREAHLRLDSDDPTIRYRARAKLSTELRSKIAVTLHHDRVITIIVNRSARQVEEPRQQIEITLRPDQPLTIRYPSNSSKPITDIWEHAGDNEEQVALSINALRQARMARMARRVTAAKHASD